MGDVKPIPDGYHSLTPYLIVDGAAEALEYYKTAFGATELFRMEHEGKIGHAEMKIGDSPFMLGDQNEQMGYKGPKAYGGSPISLMIIRGCADLLEHHKAEPERISAYIKQINDATSIAASVIQQLLA